MLPHFQAALSLLKPKDRSALLKEAGIEVIHTADGADLFRLFQILAKRSIVDAAKYGAAFNQLKPHFDGLQHVVWDSVKSSPAFKALQDTLDKEAAEHKRKTGQPYPWNTDDAPAEIMRLAGIAGLDLANAQDRAINEIWDWISGRLETQHNEELLQYSEARPPSEWERIFRVAPKTWQRMAGETVRVISVTRKSQRVHLVDLPAHAGTREQRDDLANPMKRK